MKGYTKLPMVSGFGTAEESRASLSGRNGFHIAIVVFHFISSVLATILVFQCDVARGNQQGMIPFALPPPAGITEIMAYRGGYPRGEDGEYVGNSWNPYALIMAFEWITVGFAICNLKPIMSNAQNYSWLWLAVGAILLVIWNFLNMHNMCGAMNLVLFWSFLASAMICVYFDDAHGKTLKKRKAVTPSQKQSQKDDSVIPPGNNNNNGGNNSESFLMKTSMDGREWHIPRGVKGLKLSNDTANGTPAVESSAEDDKEIMIVAFRYAEYCVTAPLLFIAVICLLTVDAPAWLFMSAYFMIMACNLLGIVLHYSITTELKGDSDKGWVLWLNDLVMTGSWRNKWVNEWYFIEASWICLLVPLSGLVYQIRFFIFSPDLPAIAQFMIWNLFVVYSLFGIIPSIMYVSGKGLHHLDWVLDVLNISAKFPLPIMIMVAFQTRPAMFKACVA